MADDEPRRETTSTRLQTGRHPRNSFFLPTENKQNLCLSKDTTNHNHPAFYLTAGRSTSSFKNFSFVVGSEKEFLPNDKKLMGED